MIYSIYHAERSSKIERMISQPLMSSSSEMVSGGVMRMAFGSNNSQNKTNPLSCALRMTSLVTSAETVMAASMRPLPRMSVINGC